MDVTAKLTRGRKGRIALDRLGKSASPLLELILDPQPTRVNPAQNEARSGRVELETTLDFINLRSIAKPKIKNAAVAIHPAAVYGYGGQENAFANARFHIDQRDSALPSRQDEPGFPGENQFISDSLDLPVGARFDIGKMARRKPFQLFAVLERFIKRTGKKVFYEQGTNHIPAECPSEKEGTDHDHTDRKSQPHPRDSRRQGKQKQQEMPL